MLNQRPTASHGVSLIELMVGLAIFAVLLAVAAPNFRDWIQNTQIRTAAEAIQNGLQLARGEAVRRNTQIRFQLTSSVSSTCATATTGTNWVISQDDPTGLCDSDPSDLVVPRIIQTRAAAAGSANAIVVAGQSVIAFNGLGRVTPVPAGNISIDISNPTGGACATAAGPMRCLRIVVTTGGQIRMCDPARTAIDPTDPQAC